MEKVVISKFLADRIVKYENEFVERVNQDECVEEFVIGEILNDCYLKDDLKISLVTLARAIEEGYEVEKEYLTLEQVMKLPGGTKVGFVDKYQTYRLIKNALGTSKILAGGHESDTRVYDWMLEPKWYVVE